MADAAAAGDELVPQFCAITGAAAHVAENYLLAHDHDLERAVDFYFQHPPQTDDGLEEAVLGRLGEPPGAQQGGQQHGGAAAAAPVADVVEIMDDDDDGDAVAELARQRARALAARRSAEAQGEGAAGGSARRASGAAPGAADGMDPDDDEALAAAVVGGAAGAFMPPDEGFGSYHAQQQQQMLAHYQALARQRQAASLADLGGSGAGAGAGSDDPDAAAVVAAAEADAAEAAAASGSANGLLGGAGSLDLPEGINLEEARMLEAAMLGVPYEGRLPDFSAAPPALGTLSPGAQEQRNLRAEQDAAYEESLALDRAKQESLAAAAAAQEARQQAEREAAEVAARSDAEAKQALAALLATKQQRLPPEPSGSEPGGSLSIVVRMPDGSRKGRRFRPRDRLQSVFDFVDLQCSSDVGDEGEGEGSRVRPGSYRLVTQFPRKVFVEGSEESLQDAGICSDSALFLEAL